jgi:hypothetical protein
MVFRFLSFVATRYGTPEEVLVANPLFPQGLKPSLFCAYYGTTEQAAEKHLLSSK